ncbi:MAG: AsmA family protein, partial [Longimicrobiales bacterium]|nr:AsmA family protein [Longimicrobiales bacterium]
MSRTLKRVGLVVAGILGVVVAVYGIAALIVTFLVDPDTLSDWVEPRMEAALNRPVELQGARVRIFPTLAAELQGVEVGNLPDFEGPPLARVAGVRLEVAILPLFRGRVRVDEVRVDDPGIHLAVNDQGVSNYGDLVPETREVEPDEEGSPLELAIREIVVRGGDLTYENVPDTLRFELVGLEADAALERAGADGEWTGEVRAGSERISLGHPALGADPLLLDGPGLRGAATAGEEFEWVEIRDGVLILGDAELMLSGRMEDLKEPARTVDLALESEALSIPGLFELLPDSVAAGVPGRGTGTLAVDLRIRGTVGPGSRPLVRGQLGLQDVGFVDRSERVLARDIDGVVDVRDDAVAFQEIRGSALDGPFSVGGTLSPDSVLSFRLSVTARPDLAQAASVVSLPEGTELAGTVDADLELAGTGREPYRTTLNGRVDAVGIRFARPTMGVPVTVDSARVTFAGDRASWQDVVLALGEDRLTVSGSVSSPLGILGPEGEVVPRLDADVSGSRLDLDRIFPARSDTAVTYGQIAFARMGGRSLRGRAAEEWATEKGLSLPDSLPGAGRVRLALDTVVSSPFRLQNVDAIVD